MAHYLHALVMLLMKAQCFGQWPSANEMESHGPVLQQFLYFASFQSIGLGKGVSIMYIVRYLHTRNNFATNLLWKLSHKIKYLLRQIKKRRV